MKPSNQLTAFLKSENEWLPSLSIDCVIFGFHNGELKVLLLKYHNVDALALPGGFVRQEESIDEAAGRILLERTGMADIYLEQFHIFGQKDRQNHLFNKTIIEAQGILLPAGHWFIRRYVSVGYYALVEFSKVVPAPDYLSDSIDWYDVQALPPLLLDHRQIIQKALDTLRTLLAHNPAGFSRRAAPLLPETFTMADLQQLYETILGQKLLRTNFQRKMLSLEVLERVDKKWTGGAHKAPYLYRFTPHP
ncbi:NUDIX domain-containing protein [Nibrella saemangeumensis]|uniref:NUDIX domain-containing protein n=1 Tax=Nibrella saemangeumensis TaxID=1084526 RepID=A0ABP8MY38_9BACT